ncbi:hypothetical protein CI109_100149 [Kwoniella shandongensis]|uniref:Uncharacterized protein n=1 Tax=Kwoniella shandongensis TaxID=1734106 RepID=A0A5M6BSP2_9TREE|nr:uncharacterized protein CI109_005747 [Kwoniella shandongensis]KAA5525866.1 hypothetical protein CI109_005747 [Kwoniella shandongensis]
MLNDPPSAFAAVTPPNIPVPTLQAALTSPAAAATTSNTATHVSGPRPIQPAPPNAPGRSQSCSSSTAAATKPAGGPSNPSSVIHRSVGPELYTPNKLAEVSNGRFAPNGQPPYTAPPDVIYPPDRIDNPHVDSMAPQPILDNMPPNSLFRPKYLPVDIDDRLDKTSVWMGVENHSLRAVYFLPPTCLCCKHPAVAQHCDRGWPNCARCISRGVRCEPGKGWGMMRPKGKRRNLKAEAAKNKAAAAEHARLALIDGENAGVVPSTPEMPTASNGIRYTSAEKGKNRADQQQAAQPIHNTQDIEMAVDEAGSLTKKRRISIEDAAHLSHNDTTVLKKPRRKSTRDSIGPINMNVPLSPADQHYFARLEENTRRPPLFDMNGPCPVWAKTKRALQAAAEYLRDPRKTAGGSVEIGVGGVARGVILEGVAEAQGIFWGTQADAGTIITSLGHPRRQRRGYLVPVPGSPPVAGTPSDPFPRPASPPFNVLPTVVHVDSQPSQAANPAERFWSEANNDGARVDVDEAPEIAALLMAQRARTPIAIAVAQDYTAVPFRVPRPFIVLGWFWVTDAWLEPVMPDLQLFGASKQTPRGPPDKVTWKFRFEWCSGDQETPWWTSSSEPLRSVDPPIVVDREPAWKFNGPGVSGATTVQLPDKPTDGSSPLTPIDLRYSHVCENCKFVSERVYDSGDICLNENCSWFFGDASSTQNHIGPISNEPGPLRPKKRVLPETLGLELRSPEPTGEGLELSQGHIGRDFWRGWVCHKCGLAQERNKWNGWNCEACLHSVCPKRRIYSDDELRSPSRPVCTGPRQEDGYASWPFTVTRSWSLFADDIKVVKHGVSIGLGEGAELHHALHHEGQGTHELARKAFMGLQVQGANEVPLKRYPLVNNIRRPADIALAPFYTYLAGPDPAPLVPAFPTGHSIPWHTASAVCLDTIDLINERAGRMFSGQPEFNSLLLAANPPNLPTSLQPRLVVEPRSYIAFLCLGSDGSMRFRSAETRVKQGELTVQHGDVVGLKTGEEAVEVLPKLDGFGFFCIARQIRPNTDILSSSRSRDKQSYEVSSSIPPEGTATPLGFTANARNGSSGDGHLSSLGQNFGAEEGAQIELNGQSFFDELVPLFKPTGSTRKSTLLPPPKPTKPAEPDIKAWYIGSFPVDKENQPLRVLPPFRERPSNQEGEEKEKMEVDEGEDKKDFPLIFLTEIPSSPKLLMPRPLSPLPGYDEEQQEVEEPIVEKTTTKKSKIVKTPVSAAKAKGKGGRKSRGSVVSAATPASTVEVELESMDGEGTPSSRGKGRGRPRGRGRKSLASEA